jgi:hypothetical protein
MQRYVFTSPRVQVASFPPAEALVPEIGVFIIGPHAPYIVEAEDAERSPDEIHIEIDQLQAKLRISEETAPSGEARLPKATKILPAAERVRLVEGKVAEVRRTPCPQGKCGPDRSGTQRADAVAIMLECIAFIQLPS